MKFKFIHTADWQIGKRFGAFDDETAANLRKARISVIERIAELACARGAAHVLVAGDVFDSENAEPSVYSQPIAKLKTYKDITWHLLPGNHDLARGRIWSGLRKEGLPENVHLYLEPGVHEIADGVQLLAAPVMTRTAVGDLTAWMDEAQTPQNDIRIGLAHGSVLDFGSEASILIDADRASKAGLDYLALGDWHGLKELDSRSWYSGTPESDGWKDNDPGYVLSVEIPRHGGTPLVEKVRVGQYVWHEEVLDVSEGLDIENLKEEFARRASQPDHLLLKLRLTGVITPADYAKLDAALGQTAGTFGAVIRREKDLEVRIIASDLETLSVDPTLHLAATRLKVAAEAGGANDDIANHALRRLFTYSARLDGRLDGRLDDSSDGEAGS